MTTRQRWQAWWEEYYTDNPVVWLIAPEIYRSLVSSQPKPSIPVMKPDKARRIAYWCWGIAFFIMLALYLMPVSRETLLLVQQNLRNNPVIVGACVLVLTFLALTQASVVGRLFAREHEGRTWTFVILTRLKGSHFVYGRVLPSMRLGGLIFIGVYCSPFILCVMVCCYGWLEGFARTLQSLWLILTFYCFLVALGARVSLTARTITASRVRLSLLWFVVYFGFFFVVNALQPDGLSDYVRWLRDNPNTAFDPRAWILSLYPVLFLASAFGAPSLFWGLPQGLAYLLIAWWLCEWSSQVLERFRRLPEPVRKQEEGT